jgi:hypothetical protein
VKEKKPSLQLLWHTEPCSTCGKWHLVHVNSEEHKAQDGEQGRQRLSLTSLLPSLQNPAPQNSSRASMESVKQGEMLVINESRAIEQFDHCDRAAEPAAMMY